MLYSTAAFRLANSMMLAQTVMQRCDILAGYSEEGHQLTRRFATEAMRQANIVVADWMQAAGMVVEYDAIGNLIGRYEGAEVTSPTLLLGSHLDTVCDAGKYDGPLGVLIALACVESLHLHQQRLPFAIEVIAFADEEGVRYRQAYSGSKAIIGHFDCTLLDQIDGEGISLRDALSAFNREPDPKALSTPRWQRDRLLGYCEVHIEQGPILEQSGLPVAAVTAISGQSRLQMNLMGEAGHAGTVPMTMRRDALCTAAEIILAVEDLGKGHQGRYKGIVATVGQINVLPGASNVIPGHVSLSLDIRHQNNELRHAAVDLICHQALNICQRRGVQLDWQYIQALDSTTCSPSLRQLLEQSIRGEGYPTHHLISGAGHDAVPLSQYMPVAMLFVRCKGGISHHPAESVKVEDVAVALRVMMRFLQLLATSQEVL